jgi:hypothetical protein
VPIREVSARMSSAMGCSLRFRGPLVAAVRATRSGVQAIGVIVSSGPGAGCVNRLRLTEHKVPRSRSRSGRPLRGLARPVLSSCSSVGFGGVCRCRRGPAARSLHLRRLASFEINPFSPPGLYGRVPSAYGRPIMRQPNYAFERTGEPSARARVRQSQLLGPSARLRRHVPAAQRER